MTPGTSVGSQESSLELLTDVLVRSLQGDSKYSEYGTTYQNDPMKWVLDCIQWREGEAPASYQVEILSQIPRETRVSVRGPHGLGKSALLSWLVLWFSTTRDALGVDWKVLTLASVWRQLERFLWPEIHKWSRRLKWETIGRDPFKESELLRLSLKLRYGEAFAISSDTPEAIEGAHADHILYIFDESKIIPDPVWDSAEGAFSSGKETIWISASTPGEPRGRFYQIQTRARGYQDWYVRHVTCDEAIQAGRISREWVQNRERQWGASSAAFRNRVLGEFAEEQDAIIPYSWVEAAIDRWRDRWGDGEVPKNALPPISSIAADIGRGGDPSTILIRYGDILGPVIRLDEKNIMAVVGVIQGILTREKTSAPVIVDVIGIGAGVVDRLRELSIEVLPFNAAERTDQLDRSGGFGFADTRSAAWWHLRELLDPNYGSTISLPPDDEDLLIGDLTSPHWKILSGGLIKVESKDEIRRRLGRSTDYGDVVVMSFWGEINEVRGSTWEDLQGLGTVEGYKSRWS